MTIHIYLWVKCDRCGKVSQSRWTNAINAAKSICSNIRRTAETAGWREINRGPSPRQHYCPACVDKPMVPVVRVDSSDDVGMYGYRE